MKKKLTALAITACMLAFAAPLGVSADVTDYDANGDGTVAITDVIFITRYLSGVGYVSDPASLDADGNGVITSGDSACIMAYLTQLSFTISYVQGS